MRTRIMIVTALVLGLVGGFPNAIDRVWGPGPILAAEPDPSLTGPAPSWAMRLSRPDWTVRR
jgi:hypothetical protein